MAVDGALGFGDLIDTAYGLVDPVVSVLVVCLGIS